MLSEWPETMSTAAPDKRVLLAELERLLERVDGRIAALKTASETGAISRPNSGPIWPMH
jgi:hypothetical protein